MKANKFLEKLSEYGEKTCLYGGDESLSFSQLLEDIQTNITLIQEITGSSTPQLFALQAQPNPSYFIRLFAITEAGHTVAPYIHASEIELLKPNFIWESQDIQKLHSNALTEAIAGGIILQTSGITGTPKIVLHQFQKIQEKYLKLRNALKSIFIFSPEHISGIETTLSILAPGGCMYFPTDRSPDTILQALHREAITHMACTPTFLGLMLLTRSDTPSHLKYINYGAERMHESLLKTLQKRWSQVQFRQAFGTTETTNVRTWSDDNAYYFKPGKTGIDYKIINDKLYLKKPPSFVKMISGSPPDIDGWYETGDLVMEHTSGYIEIVGRAEEIIHMGGEKIAPAEIERVIAKVTGVVQVKVFGKPNILTGQMICAEVVCEHPTDAERLKKEIRQYCKMHLTAYKTPQQIKIIHQPEFNRRLKRL